MFWFVLARNITVTTLIATFLVAAGSSEKKTHKIEYTLPLVISL